MTDHDAVLALVLSIRVPRSVIGLGLISLIGLVVLGAIATRGAARRQPKQ